MTPEENLENKITREDLEYLRMSASELNNFGVNLFQLGDTELALKFYKEALQAIMIVIPDDNADTSYLNIRDMKKRFQALLMRGNTHVNTLSKKKKLEWRNPVDLYSNDCGGMAFMTAYKAMIPHKTKRKHRRHKSSGQIQSGDLEAICASALNPGGGTVNGEADISMKDEKCLDSSNSSLAQLNNEVIKMKMNSPLNSCDLESGMEHDTLSHRWSPMVCLPFGPLRMSSGLLDVPLGEVELITRNNISVVVDTPLPKLSGHRDAFSEGQEWQDRDTNLTCTLTTHRMVFNVEPKQENDKTSTIKTKTRQISLSSVKEATAQGGTILFVNTQCKIILTTFNFGTVQIWFNIPDSASKEEKQQQNKNRDEMLSWLKKSLARKAWNNVTTTENQVSTPPPQQIFSSFKKNEMKAMNESNSSSISECDVDGKAKRVSWAVDLSEKSDSVSQENKIVKDENKEELDRWTEMLNQASQIQQWMTEVPVRNDCAKILHNMGLIYLINNSSYSAQKLFETAMSITRQDYEGFPHGAIVFPSCVNNIGKLMYDRGDDRALPTLFEALRLARLCLDQHNSSTLLQAAAMKEDVNEYHECIAMILSNLGRIHFRNHEYVNSLERCREALSERRKAYNGDDQHSAVLITLCNIGFIYENIGSIDEALFIYKGLFDYPFTPKNNDIQTEYFDLLLHYLSMRYSASNAGESNYNSKLSKSLEKIKIKKADNSRDLQNQQLSSLLYRAGTLLFELNEKKHALPFFLEQLSIERIRLGPHHPYLVSTLNDIGQIYHSLSLIDIALSYYQEALNVIVDVPGDDDSSHMIGIILHNIASIHFQQGCNDKAMEIINRAITLQKKHLGDDHPDVAVLLQMFGIIQMQHQEQSDEKIKHVNENFKTACTKFEYNFGVNRNAQSMYRIGTMSTWYGM